MNRLGSLSHSMIEPNPTSRCLAHRGSQTCHQPVEPFVTGYNVTWIKEATEKVDRKTTRSTKTKSQPFAQRDSDPHRNTYRDSTSQKHHSMLAPFFFPLVFTSAPPLWISPSQPSLHLRLAELMEKKSMDKAGHRQVRVSRAAIPLFLHLPKSCPTPHAHVSIHCFTNRNWHMCLVSFPPKNEKPQVMETRDSFTVLFLKTYSIIMLFISVMMALDPETS